MCSESTSVVYWCGVCKVRTSGIILDLLKKTFDRYCPRCRSILLTCVHCHRAVSTTATPVAEGTALVCNECHQVIKICPPEENQSATREELHHV